MSVLGDCLDWGNFMPPCFSSVANFAGKARETHHDAPAHHDSEKHHGNHPGFCARLAAGAAAADDRHKNDGHDRHFLMSMLATCVVRREG